MNDLVCWMCGQVPTEPDRNLLCGGASDEEGKTVWVCGPKLGNGCWHRFRRIDQTIRVSQAKHFLSIAKGDDT